MGIRLLALPLAALFLTGCGLGEAATGADAKLREAERDRRAKLQVEGRHTLSSIGEVAFFSYRRDEMCGAGVVTAETSVALEGACTNPIAPGMAGGDQARLVYGYLPPEAGVARVVLRWEDGTEAEATLAHSAFYYLNDGPDLPTGMVSLTAYDKAGNVVQAAPPPSEHTHGGH